MITSKQRSSLRALANKLKPIVIIGKDGFTTAVFSEIKTTIDNNELIKVKVLNNCDESPKQLMNEICKKINAEAISVIGNKFVIYKKSTKKGAKHIVFAG